MDKSDIYIVIWKDRHGDTTAHPFSDLEKAKDWCREQAISVCRFEEDLNEVYVPAWLYCLEYSCESDMLYIIEGKKVDEDLKST